MNFLEEIVSKKKLEVEEAIKRTSFEEIVRVALSIKPKNNFKNAIARVGYEPLKIIAEIKRASPSKGMIAGDIEPQAVAEDYESGGAAAISILTERSYFKGTTNDFRSVREKVPEIPLLRKDFIIDEYQIYESLVMGADAILLIVAALSNHELETLLSLSKKCGMSVLVEAHSESELDSALSAGAEIVGINNRNLITFEVSKETSAKLSGLIPDNVVSVSESGIHDEEGLRAAGELGYDAVLVGEHFMRSSNRKEEVRKFASFGMTQTAKPAART